MILHGAADGCLNSSRHHYAERLAGVVKPHALCELKWRVPVHWKGQTIILL